MTQGGYLTHLARSPEAEWERGLALTMDRRPPPRELGLERRRQPDSAEESGTAE